MDQARIPCRGRCPFTNQAWIPYRGRCLGVSHRTVASTKTSITSKGGAPAPRQTNYGNFEQPASPKKHASCVSPLWNMILVHAPIPHAVHIYKQNLQPRIHITWLGLLVDLSIICRSFRSLVMGSFSMPLAGSTVHFACSTLANVEENIILGDLLPFS